MSVLKIRNKSGSWTQIPTIKGDKGEKGNPFVYSDFTPEQLESLKGSKGDKGDKGDAGDDYVLTQADKQEIAGLVDAPVDDVQINGTSIVDNGIANIPIADNNKLGLMKTQNFAYGLAIENGDLTTVSAASNIIKDGKDSFRPITSNKTHISTFYGLAKAAGDTTQSVSSNPIGQYTDEAKTKIQEMIGVNDDEFELIRCITLEEDSQNVIIDTDESNSSFSLQNFLIAIVSIASEEATTEGFLKVALNSTAHNQNRIIDLNAGIRRKGSNYKNVIIIGNIMKGIGHNIMLIQMDGNGYIVDSTGVINKSLYTNTTHNAFSNQQVVNSIFIGTDSASLKLGAGSIIALYGVKV